MGRWEVDSQVIDSQKIKCHRQEMEHQEVNHRKVKSKDGLAITAFPSLACKKHSNRVSAVVYGLTVIFPETFFCTTE